MSEEAQNSETFHVCWLYQIVFGVLRGGCGLILAKNVSSFCRKFIMCHTTLFLATNSISRPNPRRFVKHFTQTDFWAKHFKPYWKRINRNSVIQEFGSLCWNEFYFNRFRVKSHYTMCVNFQNKWIKWWRLQKTQWKIHLRDWQAKARLWTWSKTIEPVPVDCFGLVSSGVNAAWVSNVITDLQDILQLPHILRGQAHGSPAILYLLFHFKKKHLC